MVRSSKGLEGRVLGQSQGEDGWAAGFAGAGSLGPNRGARAFDP